MTKTNPVVIAVRVIVSVLLISLLAAVVFMAYRLINNGGRNFYVQYADKTFVGDTKNFELEKDKGHVFYCDTVTGQTVDYDVNVFLNVNDMDNFGFSLNDERISFKKDFTEYDLSELFNVEKNATCFIIFVPSELSLQDIIQSKYKDETVGDVPDIDLHKSDSFVLTVTDSVEKMPVQIYFC